MWPTWSTSRFLPEFLVMLGVLAVLVLLGTLVVLVLPGALAELALPGVLGVLVVLALPGRWLKGPTSSSSLQEMPHKY